MFFRFFLFALSSLIPFTVAFAEDDFPYLNSLDAEDARESGRRLVGLEFGLHSLEQEDLVQDATALLIGVHGWRSQGYEWVYPLQTMDKEGIHTYFFNWDTSIAQCQAEVAENLHASVLTLLETQTSVEEVVIVGHSLGGLVVSQLADLWKSGVPLSIHVVASPLAMLEESSSESCQQQLPRNTSANVKFFQWRTQFELDNAFNRLDTNPMIVDIPNSVVVTLPDTYRDTRLGHNWSISYVAERIAADE